MPWKNDDPRLEEIFRQLHAKLKEKKNEKISTQLIA